MKRDRTGELVEDEPMLPTHACSAGFLGEDLDGRLIPCPVCKPGLIERLRKQRREVQS